MSKTEDKSNLKLEGEGTYEGAKRYQDEQKNFAKNADVKKHARKAAEALDGEEASDLEKARLASADGKTTSQ